MTRSQPGGINGHRNRDRLTWSFTFRIRAGTASNQPLSRSRQTLVRQVTPSTAATTGTRPKGPATDGACSAGIGAKTHAAGRGSAPASTRRACPDDPTGYRHLQGQRPRCIALGSRSVFGVLEVESRAGVPFLPLVAVGRKTAGALQHPGHMQQVPGHERRVAVGEVVVQT